MILGKGQVITAGLERLEAIDDGALPLKDGRILGHAERGALMGRGRDRGSLEPGKRADLVIWTEPDHRRIVNRFGYNMVDRVLIEGHEVVRGGRPIEPTDRRTAT